MMDPDEPVLEGSSLLVERSTGSRSAAQSKGPSKEQAPAADVDDDDDDDDDGAASVGRPVVDDEEEEPASAEAHGLAEAGPTAAPTTAAVADGAVAPPEVAAPPPAGESVEAIEAAVASLALQKKKASQRNFSAAVAAAPAASEACNAAAAPSQPRPAQQQRDDDADTAVAATPSTIPAAEPSSSSAPAASCGSPAAGAASADAGPSISGGSIAVASCSGGEGGGEGGGGSEEATQWSAYPKHFFILSSSGKPIYSYNGDDHSLVGLTALISALVSVVQAQGDAVQSIRSGSTLIVFMLHGPLYFVAASSTGEPAPALRRQLELLYGQLVLVVTTGLERIIQRNPSYDVRSLLDGVGGVLSSLADLLTADASYLLAAVKPLPVPAADRAATTELLAEAVRQSGAVYGLLMADTYVVGLVRAKQQPPPHPDDLLLLANFVMCNNAYRQGHGEAFSPVCLPHFNSDAFLHAYIHYIDAAAGLYLVLLSGSAEAFHQLSAARVWFEDQAASRGLMSRLRALRPPAHATATPAPSPGPVPSPSPAAGGSGRTLAATAAQQQQLLNVLCVQNLPRPLGGKFGHTALWSYAVRFQPLQQAVFSPPCPLHSTPAGAARLAASYAQLHSLLHSPAASRPNKLAWFADSRSVLVATRDRDLELYAVCDPLTDKATALGLLEALRRHFGDRGIAADVTLGAGPA